MTANATAFLSDLVALCREHGLSIAHEDSHGAFIVRPWSRECEEWLRAAQIEVPTQPEPF